VSAGEEKTEKSISVMSTGQQELRNEINAIKDKIRINECCQV
jgi:hypothetical protein